MKIVIIFAGLLVNVDQPWDFWNTMVLPAAQGTHVAELVIPEAMLMDDGQIAENERRDGHVVISLEGSRMTVKGTRGYRTPRTAAYRAAVPSLRRPGSGCSAVRPEVRRRETNAGFAFVDYRGGTELKPDSYLEKKLTFDPANNPEGTCASCAVRWEADLAGNEVRLVLERGRSSRTLRVRGGAELRVRNAPTTRISSHFGHLYDIYSDCSSRPTPRTTSGCDSVPICNEGTYASAELEPRWPAWDCTVTDEP